MAKKPVSRATKAKPKTRSKPAMKRTLDAGLLEAHKAYEAAINSNNTDLVMAMYDADAEILQPNDVLVTGHAAIRKWVDAYFRAYKTTWTKVCTANFVCGEYGWDEGHDTAVDVPYDGSATLYWDCKGILVYKRQKNGEWRIFRDIWNYNSAGQPSKVPPKK